MATDGRWVNLNLSNHPRARTEFSAIYDSNRGRMVIFGGVGKAVDGTTDSTLSDVWALNLDSSPAVWRQLTVSNSAPDYKSDYAAAYDVTNDRMIIFGGEHHVPGHPTSSDVSAKVTYLTFTGDTTASWSDGPSASPPNYPCPRSGAAAFWNQGRLIVFGGAYRASSGASIEGQDLWALQLDTGVWTQLSPRDHCKAHNAANDCSCWTDDAGGAYCDSSIVTVGQLGDTSCTPQNLVCRIPERRQYPASAFDADNSRWVIHGGWYETTEEAVIGAYAWSQSSTTNCWATLNQTSSTWRWNHKAVYAASRHSVVFFGGQDGSTWFNETWEIKSDGTIQQLSVGPTPPSGREYCAAVYDPTCDRMVIFGGNDSSDNPLGDTWALYFGTDTNPPNAVTDFLLQPSTHSITASWTAPSDDSPTEACKEYDLRYSTSALTEGNFANATRVVIPPPQAPGTFESATISGLASCTKYYVGVKSRDESCNWSSLVSTNKTTSGTCGPHSGPLEVTEVPKTLEFLSPQPNPIRSSVSFEARVPPAMVGMRANLIAYDAVGRRVRTIYSGLAALGTMQQRWDLTNDRGERVSGGVYFVRFAVGGEVRTRTILVESP